MRFGDCSQSVFLDVGMLSRKTAGVCHLAVAECSKSDVLEGLFVFSNGCGLRFGVCSQSVFLDVCDSGAVGRAKRAAWLGLLLVECNLCCGDTKRVF
jgi:hypothetical protein